MSEYAHPGALISTDWDARHRDDENVRLVKVNVDTALYEQGRIPGASSIPWSRAVNDEDGTFRSADELRQIYQTAGITGEKPVITYCRIGERSSHSWFVLTHLLGLRNVKNYDGSWTEWGAWWGPRSRPAQAEPPPPERSLQHRAPAR